MMEMNTTTEGYGRNNEKAGQYDFLNDPMHFVRLVLDRKGMIYLGILIFLQKCKEGIRSYSSGRVDVFSIHWTMC